MIKSNEVAYVLVADGGHAKIYEAIRENGDLEVKLLDYFQHDTSPTRDIGVEKPSRVFDSTGGHRHAAEPKVDFHQQAETDFMKDVSSLLEKLYIEHIFDKLVLMAAPRALGDLRKSLSKEVQNVIVAEINKDLTKAETEEIRTRLLEDLIL